MASMDLHALKAFMAVTSGGNMTAAAKELGLTQSAVSQSVRQLEEQFGVVLVDRSTRPLRLTAAGSIVRRYAERMLNDAEQMAAAIHSTGTIPELRIALVDSFAATAGAEFIRTAARHAQNLYVGEGFSTVHAQEFRARKLDMVVSPDPMDELEGVVRHPLLREPFVLIAPPALLRDGGTAVDVARLDTTLPIIRYSSRSAAGLQIDHYLHGRGVKLRRRIEVETSEVMCGLVAGGMGWGMTTPLHLLQARAHLDGIVVRPLAPALQRTLYLIVRSGECETVAAALLARMHTVLTQSLLPPMRALLPAAGKERDDGFFIFGAQSP